MNCSFELFYDLKVEDDLETFPQRAYEGHSSVDSSGVSARLDQIIQDFKAMRAEKRYTENFKTKTEAARFLLKQGWIPDRELMRFPVGRLFTIQQEIDAIHKLTDGHEQINFKYFAVVIPQASKVGTK